MDIQSLNLSKEQLTKLNLTFQNALDTVEDKLCPNLIEINNLIDLIRGAKKPIFLLGNGLRLSKNGQGINLIKNISLENSIPIITTYLGVDFFDVEFRNYLGVVGLKATRIANLIVNNSDLLICIGTRLATSVIGFEYDLFAPNAKKIIVDIDEYEHKKPNKFA